MGFQRRLLVLLAVVAVLSGVVWLRLAQLQLLEGDEWRLAAQELRERPDRPGAPRGRIVDADGVVLAEDVPEPRIVLLGWEWQRRARARCEGCGTVLFYEAEDGPPRRCPCRRPDAKVIPLLPEDLAPLEGLLGLEPGSVARLADGRIAEIRRMTEDFSRRLLESGEEPFFVDDRAKFYEEDLLRRPYVVFEGDVPEEALRLLALDEAGRYRGLRLEPKLRRRYPQRDLAPQLLGYATPIFKEEYERLTPAEREDTSMEARVGRRGLERTYDGLLKGRPGRRTLGRDEDGAFTVVKHEDPPQPGLTVRLTATVAAMRAAERVIGPDRWASPERFAPGGQPSAAFVAMDAESGAILAWGEAPRYDLEKDLARIADPAWTDATFDSLTSSWLPAGPLPPGETTDTWRAQLVKPDPLVLSRVSEIPVEPGSSMKPFVGLAMLESGRGLPWERYVCTGGHDYPRCHHGGHGSVDFEEATAVSCNRFFAMALGDSPLADHYRSSVAAFLDRVGFGHVVFGDTVGRRGRGLWLRTAQEGEWKEGETPRIGRFDGRFVAIGQGRVTATPLHLVRAAALVANGGRLVVPHVVASVGGTPQAHRVVEMSLSPESLRRVRAGMRRVTEDGGTAAAADWSRVPADVFGKTGTAQVGSTYDPDGRETGDEPWHHWFVGFAEAPGRRTIAFACLLFARQEAAAGMTAAHATAEFLEWWFAQGLR